jgi:hypothetical protein
VRKVEIALRGATVPTLTPTLTGYPSSSPSRILPDGTPFGRLSGLISLAFLSDESGTNDMELDRKLESKSDSKDHGSGSFLYSARCVWYNLFLTIIRS